MLKFNCTLMSTRGVLYTLSTSRALVIFRFRRVRRLRAKRESNDSEGATEKNDGVALGISIADMPRGIWPANPCIYFISGLHAPAFLTELFVYALSHNAVQISSMRCIIYRLALVTRMAKIARCQGGSMT